MRKPNLSVLLIITILFAAFTLGFFLGRTQTASTITVSVPAKLRVPPTEETKTETLPPETAPQIVFPISINQAGKQELMALPGIGEVLAQRILDYRQETGGFSAVEELLNVEGIGEKRLEEILEFITIGG